MTHRGLFYLLPLVLIAPIARGADPAAAEFFEKKIRPVLVEHCFECHSAKAEKLGAACCSTAGPDCSRAATAAPRSFPATRTRAGSSSAVRYKDVDLQMPESGKLPDAVIADLTAWVQDGRRLAGTTAGRRRSVKKRLRPGNSASASTGPGSRCRQSRRRP